MTSLISSYCKPSFYIKDITYLPIMTSIPSEGELKRLFKNIKFTTNQNIEPYIENYEFTVRNKINDSINMDTNMIWINEDYKLHMTLCEKINKNDEEFNLFFPNWYFNIEENLCVFFKNKISYYKSEIFDSFTIISYIDYTQNYHTLYNGELPFNYKIKSVIFKKLKKENIKEDLINFGKRENIYSPYDLKKEHCKLLNKLKEQIMSITNNTPNHLVDTFIDYPLRNNLLLSFDTYVYKINTNIRISDQIRYMHIDQIINHLEVYENFNYFSFEMIINTNNLYYTCFKELTDKNKNNYNSIIDDIEYRKQIIKENKTQTNLKEYKYQFKSIVTNKQKDEQKNEQKDEPKFNEIQKELRESFFNKNEENYDIKVIFRHPEYYKNVACLLSILVEFERKIFLVNIKFNKFKYSINKINNTIYNKILKFNTEYDDGGNKYYIGKIGKLYFDINIKEYECNWDNWLKTEQNLGKSINKYYINVKYKFDKLEIENNTCKNIEEKFITITKWWELKFNNEDDKIQCKKYKHEENNIDCIYYHKDIPNVIYVIYCDKKKIGNFYYFNKCDTDDTYLYSFSYVTLEYIQDCLKLYYKLKEEKKIDYSEPLFYFHIRNFPYKTIHLHITDRNNIYQLRNIDRHSYDIIENKRGVSLEYVLKYILIDECFTKKIKFFNIIES